MLCYAMLNNLTKHNTNHAGRVIYYKITAAVTFFDAPAYIHDSDDTSELHYDLLRKKALLYRFCGHQGWKKPRFLKEFFLGF